jgi:hypothetical protein
MPKIKGGTMDMCGYHIRCLNYGKNCSECGQQQKGKDTDYLNDMLKVWPKGKEAVAVLMDT